MTFAKAVQKFNTMYKMPVNDSPTLDIGLPLVQRLLDFKKIMLEEIAEVDLIVEKIEVGTPDLDILTDLADWLGDIQVYAASEMAKFGLPQEAILDLIMASNFSKMGVDGKPIFDEKNKLQKGPNYWKPEPAISYFLKGLRNEAKIDMLEKDIVTARNEAWKDYVIWAKAKSNQSSPSCIPYNNGCEITSNFIYIDGPAGSLLEAG